MVVCVGGVEMQAKIEKPCEAIWVETVRELKSDKILSLKEGTKGL